jgi:hypothetical protein
MFAVVLLDPWTFAFISLFPLIGALLGYLKTCREVREDPEGSTYWGHRWQRNYLDKFLDK